MSVQEGITGWVVRGRKPALVPDVRQDARYVAFLAGTRSELAVPLFKGDQVLGVLNIEHPRVDAFTQSDVELAKAIAGLAVVAIENARLYEQRIQDLSALIEVNRAIPSQDIGEITRLISENAARLTEAENCTLRLVDPSGQCLELYAEAGRKAIQSHCQLMRAAFRAG